MRKSMIDQVEDKQGLLLMYIADELSPADRLVVERMLQTEPTLKLEYDVLSKVDRDLQTSALDAVDEHRLERAIASAQRAMRAAPAIPSTIPAIEQKRLPLPWWLYPMAAAASIVIAAAVFMANLTPPSMEAIAVAPRERLQLDLTVSGLDIDVPMTGDAYAMAEDLAASFDDSDRLLAGANGNGLWSAARELDELRASSRQFSMVQ